MNMKQLSGLTVNKFLSLFELFSYNQQVKIASIIQKKTLAERWHELSNSLPDMPISERDVMREVKAVRRKRYGGK